MQPSPPISGSRVGTRRAKAEATRGGGRRRGGLRAPPPWRGGAGGLALPRLLPLLVATVPAQGGGGGAGSGASHREMLKIGFLQVKTTPFVIRELSLARLLPLRFRVQLPAFLLSVFFFSFSDSIAPASVSRTFLFILEYWILVLPHVI